MSSKEEVPEEKPTSHTRVGLAKILAWDFGFTPEDDARIKGIAEVVKVASKRVKDDLEKNDPGISERISALEAQETE